VTINQQVSGQAAGESACRPGSVRPLARAGGHPSRAAVADSLKRSTREHRAGHPQLLAQDTRTCAVPSDLAPGGVYRAAQVTLSAGGLLHHRFTLTPGLRRRRFAFCGTVPRVTPGRRYRPPCPWSPDLPRRARELARRGRPADSSAASIQNKRSGTGGAITESPKRARRAALATLPALPACLRAKPVVSESGCRAGCRTHRCRATERTSSARNLAARWTLRGGWPGGCCRSTGCWGGAPTCATLARSCLTGAWPAPRLTCRTAGRPTSRTEIRSSPAPSSCRPIRPPPWLKCP